MSALNWRTITGARNPRFLVKGSELSVAFFAGHRFAVYEVRTFDGVNHDREYIVRDAHMVSDAEIREGKRPPIVFRTNSHTVLSEFVKRSMEARHD